MPDLVVVVSQRARRTHQQRCQPVLAFYKRQRSHVLAVQVEQVEEEEHQRSLTGIGRVLNEVESRPPIRQHPAKFAVKVGVPRRKPSNRLCDGRIFVCPVVASAIRICTLPVSSRACIRYPSNLISCSQSVPSGAFSTSLASCGLIQVGGEAGSPLRRVVIMPVDVARDFAMTTNYQTFAPCVSYVSHRVPHCYRFHDATCGRA